MIGQELVGGGVINHEISSLNSVEYIAAGDGGDAVTFPFKGGTTTLAVAGLKIARQPRISAAVLIQYSHATQSQPGRL